MLQPPSTRVARVFSAAASDPVSGSVSPKQPRISPEQSRGSHLCFCSSLPQRWIDEQTSDVCTDTTVRADESARPPPPTIGWGGGWAPPPPPYSSATIGPR